ncbi:MAG: hypothetical protein ACWGHV_08110 [Stutzerimonas stutzeri]
MAKDFAFRKRQDGGYTIASRLREHRRDRARQFSLHAEFPAGAEKRVALAALPRLGKRFLEEGRMAQRWRDGSQETPFERCRVLDPKPDLTSWTNHALAQLKTDYPVFDKAEIEQRWGGYDRCDAGCGAGDFAGRGRFRASSSPPVFPATVSASARARGRLMADLVTGHAPGASIPTPFRLSRFSDGSRSS